MKNEEYEGFKADVTVAMTELCERSYWDGHSDVKTKNIIEVINDVYADGYLSEETAEEIEDMGWDVIESIAELNDTDSYKALDMVKAKDIDVPSFVALSFSAFTKKMGEVDL